MALTHFHQHIKQIQKSYLQQHKKETNYFPNKHYEMHALNDKLGNNLDGKVIAPLFQF